MKKEFATPQELIAVMRKHTITQQVVADILGCSKSLVCYWICGKRKIGAHYFQKLIKQLNTKKNVFRRRVIRKS